MRVLKISPTKGKGREMVTRRSRLEIMVDVLRAINKGIDKPTRIMYKANLSWNSLTEALNSLLEQGLIMKKDGDMRIAYEIADKGKQIVNFFDEVKTIIQTE